MVTYSVSLVSSSLTLGKLKTFCTNVHAPLSDGISAAPTSQISRERHVVLFKCGGTWQFHECCCSVHEAGGTHTVSKSRCTLYNAFQL
jgi:hypothetical protein